MNGVGVRRAPHGERATQLQKRSPLEHLLHALNQPLTGLQCSLELACAGTRSPEQYRHTLQEGLDLIARMRILVDALRELADIRQKNATEEMRELEWDALLRETCDGLRPVAETKQVRICIVGHAASLIQADPGLPGRLFRLLDSALILAQRESEMEIGATRARSEMILTFSWTPGLLPDHSPFSGPELGLLIAQAEWEQAGAAWDRLRRQGREVCTIRFRVSGDRESGESK